MNYMPQFFRNTTVNKVACCALLVLLLVADNGFGQNVVTVNSNVVGTTPSVIGLNSGNYISGANTTSYWRWTGVNGARIFTSAPNIEQVDDIPGHGDGVNSEASFIIRRAAVRANPTDPTLINFAEFERGYSSNEDDFINYDLAYSELSSNGISPLAIINRTVGSFPSPPMEPLLVGQTAGNIGNTITLKPTTSEATMMCSGLACTTNRIREAKKILLKLIT